MRPHPAHRILLLIGGLILNTGAVLAAQLPSLQELVDAAEPHATLSLPAGT